VTAPTHLQAPSTIAVAARGIVKSFGAVRANRGASLEVASREVHALVGENGAGKSTLMRIVSGMFAPDAGTIEVDGRDVTGWSTDEAITAGVGMVHQHFMLVPTLTVAENIVLGREPSRRGLFDRGRAVRDVEALSERTGLRVDPNRTVSALSVGEAQRVEILRVLFRGARILLLDEPTAVLSPPEIRDLWRILGRLRDDGTTVVLITHKLDEVMDVSDMVTVMRQGETMLRTPTRDTSPAALARAMVGRDVVLAGSSGATTAIGATHIAGGDAPMSAQVAGTAGATGSASPSAQHGRPLPKDGTPIAGGVFAVTAPPTVIAVRDLVVPSARNPRAVDGVSFSVVAGEIFGIAGVEGNGQTELIEALSGLRAATAGSIHLGARDIGDASVRARADYGISHIPEDRHRRGLILEYSIADNLILGAQHHFARRGLLERDRIAANADERMKTFDIRPPNGSLPARALSGGNQQKIVVAREMAREFSLLLAAQPTRGVDVGAIEQIHDRLRAARGAGKAIILVSAELAEVMALADRIAVMYGGRFAVVMRRADATEELLGRYMTGAAEPTA
jgi:simple sugar transport system ATP-binding protein